MSGLLGAILMAMAINPSLLLVPPAEAASLTTDDIKTIAVADAAYYHLNAEHFLATIQCESQFNPEAVGSLGELGVVQILPSAHPDITKDEMLDSYWAINWMAQQWSQNQESEWSCWREMYGKK